MNVGPFGVGGVALWDTLARGRQPVFSPQSRSKDWRSKEFLPSCIIAVATQILNPQPSVIVTAIHSYLTLANFFVETTSDHEDRHGCDLQDKQI